VALKKAKRNFSKDPGIAVLTPYKAQKKLVEGLVKENKLNITVRTINESQGDNSTNMILKQAAVFYAL